jgi:site-specific recombinase XerD
LWQVVPSTIEISRRQVSNKRIQSIRRVLTAFELYFECNNIKVTVLTVEHIDAFFAEFNGGFSAATCRECRSIIRGFLSYLYHQRQIIERDLAPVVVGAPMFAKAKPATFLGSEQVKKLFDSIDRCSQSGLRTYTMLQLAYTLGLHPVEICQITLDDISFRKAELNIGRIGPHAVLSAPVRGVKLRNLKFGDVGIN